MKCTYCQQDATWLVSGWVEEGPDTAYSEDHVCDAHVQMFRDGSYRQNPDVYGLSSVTTIKPYTQEAAL